MTRFGRLLIVISAFLAAAGYTDAADFSPNKGLSATAGLEYQVISQEFYDALIKTLDTGLVDIIETWDKSKDEISDFIFRTNVAYLHSISSNDINFLVDMELSSDRLLGRGEGYYQIGDYDNNLRLFGKFENRSPHGNDNEFVQGYNYLETYLKKRQRISDITNIHFKIGYRLTNFVGDFQTGSEIDTVYRTIPNYDYFIRSARIGGDFAFSPFSNNLGWQFSYFHRQVPDSSEADYDHYRFGTDFNFTDMNGFINLGIEIENKDYIRPSGVDDYTAYGFDGRISRDIGRNLDLGMWTTFDLYRFRKPDVINRNYQLIKTEFKVLRRFNHLVVGPLLRRDFRRENQMDGYSNEYDQWELGIQVNILTSQALFLDADVTYGHRDYLDETSILTSYRAVSISLIANYSITDKISLNIFTDSNIETHGRLEDNSNLYLISAGLSVQL